MDDAAFDALARVAGRASNRRRVLALLGGGMAAAVAAGPGRGAAAQERCDRWVLSGGPEGTEPIGVDDQLFVYLNGDRIYGARDQEAGFRPPLVFRARRGDKLKVAARDTNEPCYQLNALYLGCYRSNADSRRLDRGVTQTCGQSRPKGIFFSKTFTVE